MDGFLYAANHLLLSLSKNPIGLSVLVLAVHSLIIRMSNKSLLGAWLSNIVGVFFHELAHAVVGLFLFAKPTKFIIFPSQSVDSLGRKSYTLGQVQFSNLRWYNAFPSAMSPLLLLVSLLYLEQIYWKFAPECLWSTLGYIYLLVVMSINAIPSRVDFCQAFKNPIGASLWIAIILFICNKNSIIIDYFMKLL